MSDSENLPETKDSYESSVQNVESDLKTKNINAVDENNPLARGLGSTGSQERTMNIEKANEVLAESIYSDDSSFIREFLQNAQTACIRAARILLRAHPDYGVEWLNPTIWVNTKTGETLDQEDANQSLLTEWFVDDAEFRKMNTTRSLHEIVEAARDLGYDPTIEIDLYRDEREIVIEDNGIGMTVKEFNDAYNSTFDSGSSIDGDTGGKWGIGAMTFGAITGKQGGMEVTSRTRRPDAKDYDYEGIKAYTYLAGFDPMPSDDIDDDFRGTRFDVPIQESVNMDKFLSWTRKYASKLAVPVLYQEHEAGRNREKEEFGGQPFAEAFGETPPVVIDRPGEFTLIAGPDLPNSYKDPDTWLVGMEIDRNTKKKVKSFWKVLIHIHDEQGKIVMGPHRGEYRNEVEKREGKLHELDAPMPEPTTDRDRLQRDDETERFFAMLSEMVKDAEMQKVSDIADKMRDADHPTDVIRNDSQSWELFYRMVDYHGYNATKYRNKFDKFVDDHAELSEWDNELREQVFRLFEDVSYAGKQCHAPHQKSSRTERMLGKILSSTPPERVFMGKTINEDKYKVVHDTFDDPAVISISDASIGYDQFEDIFGFQRLNDVPMQQSDDHDFEVSDAIHSRHKRKKATSNDGGKADNIDGVTLKFRTNKKTQSIDKRVTIGTLTDKLDDGIHMWGHKYVILFPRSGDANISDHYSMQAYGAIASCSTDEFDVLSEYDRVVSYEEFNEMSENAVMATSDGAMTAAELSDADFAVVVYAHNNTVKTMMADTEEMAQLRYYYAEDEVNGRYWSTGSDKKPEIEDAVVGVADDRTLEKMAYAINKRGVGSKLHGVKTSWGGSRGNYYKGPASISFDYLFGSESEYRLKAKTPEWDDDSGVYSLLKDADSLVENMILGLYDVGLDPMDMDALSLRKIVGTVDDRGWNKDSEWPEGV